MRYELNPKGFTDWQGLYKLLHDSFAYMQGIIDPPSSLYKLTADNLRRKANLEALLLVFDNQKLIACGFFDTRDDVIYIGKIAVAKTHQGRGIANNIFNIAEIFALDNDKKYLELETRIELTSNHLAFGKMGFITTAHNSHVGYNRVTSITMQRAITQL